MPAHAHPGEMRIFCVSSFCVKEQSPNCACETPVAVAKLFLVCANFHTLTPANSLGQEVVENQSGNWWLSTVGFLLFHGVFIFVIKLHCMFPLSTCMKVCFAPLDVSSKLQKKVLQLLSWNFVWQLSG
jgi:hypothetical protein